MENLKVLILGKGRIGKAVSYYLKKMKATQKVAFFSNGKQVKNFNLLIGALPGDIGEKSLKLALNYKKDLIDVSDSEPEFYFEKGKKIKRKKITVVPGCGFCPGLVNLILGREIADNKNIQEIEIKIGSLSPKKFYFPFLFCFEDLIWEDLNPSWQIINSKKRKFSPSSGYQEEKFFGIDAESYFAQSGFDNLIQSLKIENFKFRIVRPFGFSIFLKYLENYGFLKEKNLETTKKFLDSKLPIARQKEDNLTFAEIQITTKSRKIIWRVKSFSKSYEKLNSMQKITGLMPAIFTQFFSTKKIKERGILLMEDIGKDKILFKEILKKLKKEVNISRKIS